ncbi:hypothetical protein TC41_1855 [Alicyclobacillus acidocaldarius subsp. acidocaldarius Tc-4-1]|uniref:Uncharacterized protein n=1 Tax=Alicyclobacillus acidocaldarius (strain Tc-4-1) TaxID=1048834 RepID=F8ICV7_ALIAT|nr:hypothetical protein TC41_1855 [Alicyclobacillus acidocaldarius subsp. acidocaldarius Tc-4-1]
MNLQYITERPAGWRYANPIHPGDSRNLIDDVGIAVLFHRVNAIFNYSRNIH